MPRDPNNVSKFDDACRCPHCATPLFQGEKSTMCCYDDKFKLPTGPPNPPELEELLVPVAVSLEEVPFVERP